MNLLHIHAHTEIHTSRIYTVSIKLYWDYTEAESQIELCCHQIHRYYIYCTGRINKLCHKFSTLKQSNITEVVESHPN